MLEIGWSPFQEIQWSPLEEIGWVPLEEILHHKTFQMGTGAFFEFLLTWCPLAVGKVRTQRHCHVKLAEKNARFNDGPSYKQILGENRPQ